jgi:hypothetical protein
MSTKRDRFSGNAEALLAIISPFACKKKWLVYDECEKVKDAKTMPVHIAEQTELLRALHQVQPNLSFVRSVIATAMGNLFDNKAVELCLKGEYRSSWIDVHTRRLMNLCHAVAQGIAKSANTPWVKELGLKGTVVPEPLLEEAKEYTFGYDVELKKAWRQQAGSRSKKEISDRMEVPENALPHHQVVAKWLDGASWNIPDITVAMFKEMTDSVRRGNTEALEFFSGEHCSSHHKIVVKARTDRQPLMSMFEQGRQILQVAVARFDGKPEDATTLAGKFMANIATLYSQDKLQPADLKGHRDRGLAESWPKVKVVRKKPAAASSSAATLEKAPVTKVKAGAKSRKAAKTAAKPSMGKMSGKDAEVPCDSGKHNEGNDEEESEEEEDDDQDENEGDEVEEEEPEGDDQEPPVPGELAKPAVTKAVVTKPAVSKPVVMKPAVMKRPSSNMKPEPEIPAKRHSSESPTGEPLAPLPAPLPGTSMSSMPPLPGMSFMMDVYRAWTF